MDKSVQHGLFSLRVTVFILMIVWAGLKVFVPGSYAGAGENPGIFQNFYGLSVGSQVVIALGIVQIGILIAYVLGLFKTITSGAVLLMNLATLIVSYERILFPFAERGNLLFLAAVPIAGASLAHFLMRKYDTFLSLGK